MFTIRTFACLNTAQHNKRTANNESNQMQMLSPRKLRRTTHGDKH